MRDFHLVITLLASLTFAVSCSSDKKKEKKSKPSEDTGVVLAQPKKDPNAVNKFISQVALSKLKYEIDGVPAEHSPIETLSMKITSSEVTHFRWGFIEEETCQNVTYSDWVIVSTPIAKALGSDGLKRVCIMLTGLTSKGKTAFSSFSHSWTKDSTNPSMTMATIDGLGPNAFLGNTIPMSGTASDNLTGLKTTGVSIQLNSGKCLDKSMSGFKATCPFYVPVTITDGDWNLEVPKTLFSDGNSYKTSIFTEDLAGNSFSKKDNLNLTWDSTPPSTPGSVTVTGGQELFDVSYSSVSGANQYLVVRRKGASVTYSPPPGIHFENEQYLGNDHVVAYIGKNTSFQDTGVDPNIFYYYRVFAVDGAYNIGGGKEASDVAEEIPRFKGIKWANLAGDGLKAEVVWDPFTQGASPHSQIEYEVYVSDDPESFDWADPVDSVTGETRMTITIPPAASDAVYVAVRDHYSNGDAGSNESSLKLNLVEGYFHRIANNYRYEGLDPLLEINPLNPYAVDHDDWGNVVFADGTSNIYVYCLETQSAPYCVGRTSGKVYFLAGRDGRSDGADEMIGAEAPSGIIYSLEVDAYGNVYFADHTYYRIRVLCMAPANPASAFCFGKKTGYVYHFAGNGAAGDGLDDAIALGEPIGNPRSIAVDKYNNVFISDEDYRRIRLVCSNQPSSICSGKKAWYTYRLIGTGSAGDGGDDVDPSTTTIGRSYAIDVDDKGNIYFEDNDWYRIRAVCYDNSVGFCSGKTVGNMYHVAGTGSNDGDGPPDFVAVGSKIGQSRGIVVDHNYNLWYPDATYRRVRVICYDTTDSQFCSGKTSGNIYWAAGDASVNDAPNSVEAVIHSIGSINDLSIDTNGNAVLTDYSYERLRLVCFNTSASGPCQGKNQDYQYHFVGNTVAKKGPVDVPVSTGVHIGDASGITKDSKGNIYFADTYQDIVRVLCNDTSGTTGACVGKQRGYVYRVAGTGSASDGGDDLPAHLTPMNNPYGLALDSNDNLYITDSAYERIRIVCYDTASAGFCNGRNPGFVYRAYGTGTTGDGSDDADATTTAMGTVYDVTIDSLDNVYVADSQYRRVRVICNETASGGFCNGKTTGNVYHYAGTGSNGDGDTGVATSTNMGAVTAIAFDAYDNAYIADTTFERIRVVCIDVASPGFCNGKTSGNIYRMAGDGSTGNGADDVDALSDSMGTPISIGLDGAGNVYIGDYDYYRIRVVCNENTTNFCNGKTVGNIYHYAGTGTSSNDPTNLIPANQTRIGRPARAGLMAESNGVVLFTDQDNDTIRMITGY